MSFYCVNSSNYYSLLIDLAEHLLKLLAKITLDFGRGLAVVLVVLAITRDCYQVEYSMIVWLIIRQGRPAKVVWAGTSKEQADIRMSNFARYNLDRHYTIQEQKIEGN